MGFLDRIAGKSFRQDEQGRVIYYFWGRFGKGRVVPSPEDGAWVRRYLKIAFIAFVVALVIAFQFTSGSRGDKLVQVLPGAIIVFALAGVPLWLRVRNWALSDLPLFDKRRS